MVQREKRRYTASEATEMQRELRELHHKVRT